MEKIIKELVEELNAASEAYYNGKPLLMEDYEWNEKFDELLNLEMETGIVLPDSPTQKVSSDNTKGKREQHEFPALSLDKTKNVDDLIRWADGRIVNMSWKLDGLTLVATYDKGKLTKLLTRGNGITGTNVTRLASAIKGIPAKINYSGHLVVRGEAVISYADFERINEELADLGKKTYENARNLASGTMNLDDVQEVARRNVQFIAFTPVFIENSVADKDFLSGYCMNSWSDRMSILDALGFNTVEYQTLNVGFQLTIDEFTEKVKDFEFPVDGLVICYDDWDYSQTGSVTGHHATRAGYAFKWPDKPVTTTITGIDYEITRTGLISQVALLAPVRIAGTTVTRAAIPNLNFRSDMDLKIGDEVDVIKANMIIPQIVGNHNKNVNRKVFIINDMKRYNYPVKCPCCGGLVAINTSETDVMNLICSNPHCTMKQIKQIAHFADRECMDIMGLSKAKIEFLLAHGFIANILDLYSLSNQYKCAKVYGRILSKDGLDLSSFEGWGDKSVENLINAIDKSRNTDFIRFIAAMGIPNVGKGQAKLIKKHLEEIYPDYEDAMINTLGNDGSYDLMGLLYLLVVNYDYDFRVIDGIGEVINDSFRNWIITNLCDPNPEDIETHKPNAMVLNLLDELTFTDKKPEKAAASNNSNNISGKTFVITGDVYKFKNRKELQEKIEALGGKCTGSVSKKTDFLINNDVASTSGKNQKAKELGVPIISEDDFLKMIETIIYIRKEDLPKYWETNAICIEFADGTDVLAQENGYTLEQCLAMTDAKFFLD